MECKKEKTIRTTRRKQNFKKKTNKVRLRNLWDNFKMSNIQIIAVPEGEEKEQETGNLFEKNNERKLP